MTIRSIPSIRAVLSALILFVIALFPATAWLQEPAADKPSQSRPPVAASTQPPAAEQTGKYEIRQNDTLWDIANAFYRDPFLWPLIWKSNPSINDPDLIYPGNVLVIPSLAPVERAMNAPEEPAPVQEKVVEMKGPETAPQEEQPVSIITQERQGEAVAAVAVAEEASTSSGSKLIMPETAPTPIADKYAMLSAGFVSDESSKDYLQGSVEDPTRGVQGSSIVGADQEVYIVVRSRETVNIGDRFLIFEEDHKVRHPVTGRDFGKLYKVNGIAKVTGPKENDDGVYKARITLSFDAAMRGNLLTPYQEPTLLYPSREKQVKNLSGCILEVPDRRSISGQADIVYLDKGKEDGVDPGDRFIVMSEPNPSTGIRRPIGEIQVFIVKARTATAFVTKSIDALSKGYSVVFKNEQSAANAAP